ILGAGCVALGTDMRPVPVRDNGNLVDAAVVKVENPSQIDPSFGKLGKLRMPNRGVLAHLHRGAPIKKLGNFTKDTSGNLILHCEKTNVSDCTGVAREYHHQLAIVTDG